MRDSSFSSSFHMHECHRAVLAIDDKSHVAPDLVRLLLSTDIRVPEAGLLHSEVSRASLNSCHGNRHFLRILRILDGRSSVSIGNPDVTAIDAIG